LLIGELVFPMASSQTQSRHPRKKYKKSSPGMFRQCLISIVRRNRKHPSGKPVFPIAHHGP
ncbi:MAG TPA: hypothetical protein VGS10_09985, partial [Terracidiphilus sp.]|nr:hypothetical protein [Terracidiphilus sp.]